MDLSKYLRSIINYLLPPRCVFCFGLGLPYNICSNCQQYLPSLPQKCQQCAQFLPSSPELICGRCLSDPPAFERTFVLFPYLPPIPSLITRLKFKGELANAKVLGELMQAQIPLWYEQIAKPDLIIPVPLHAQRLAERGFNQALEIAKPISRAFAIPIDAAGVQRKKATRPQSSLNAKERQRNIKNAFITHRDYNGCRIAILDDVMTTGQTVRELSKTLQEKGAKVIHILSCARGA